MKAALCLICTLIVSASYANGFNNDDLEKIARQSFVELDSGCMVENEAPVVSHQPMDNYETRTTLNFGFAEAVITHGIDGIGIVGEEYYCLGSDGSRLKLN